MTKEEINKHYELLAAQLGDLVYKLELLSKRKEALVQEIIKLDALAGQIGAENEKKNEEAQGDNSGSNSAS